MTEERFYHFYYPGIQQPITILAPTKIIARQILAAQELPPQYYGLMYEEEKCSHPIPGISTMMAGDKKLIWVGKDKSPTGWQEANENNKRKVNL